MIVNYHICNRIVLLAIFLVTIFPIQSQCQTSELDSLLKRVEAQNGLEGKLILLDDLSWEARQQYPDGALILARRGLKLAKKNSKLEYQEKFLSRIASAYYNLQEIDSAIYFLDKALDLAKERKDKNSQAGISFNLSLYQGYKGEYPAALEYTYQALQLYKELEKSAFVARSYQRLAEVQAGLGRTGQAKKSFQAALEISQKLGDTLRIIQQLQSLGTLQSATAHKNALSPEEGIQYLNSAKAIAQTNTQYNQFLPTINSNLGLAYSRKGDCKNAVQYFSEAIDQINLYNTHSPLTRISLYENYARCLIDLDKKKQGEFWANEALQQAELLKNPQSTLGVYRLMVEIFEEKADYQNALKYQKLAADQADFLRNEARDKEVARIQKDFEIRQSELEASEARALQRKSEYGIYALLAGLLALGVCSFLVIQFLRKDQKQREEMLLKKNEEERQKLLEQLRKKELQSYSAAIEAQEMERRRIAAELHDGVGGIMAALKMTFSSLESKLPNPSPQYKSYTSAMKLLDNAVKEVRQLSHQMAARQLLA